MRVLLVKYKYIHMQKNKENNNGSKTDLSDRQRLSY